MDELTPKAKWTVTQPWRGLFGTALTLWVAFAIAAAFDMQELFGQFYVVDHVVCGHRGVMGLGWGGKFPSVAGWPQPWPGLFLTGFMIVVATLAYFTLRAFVSGGAAHPARTPCHLHSHHDVLSCSSFRDVAIPEDHRSYEGVSDLAPGLCDNLRYLAAVQLHPALVSRGGLPFPDPSRPLLCGGRPPRRTCRFLPDRADPPGRSIFSFYFWMLVFLFVFVIARHVALQQVTGSHETARDGYRRDYHLRSSCPRSPR